MTANEISNNPFRVDKYFWLTSHYANFFDHPKNWEPVLHPFPQLRLNLGHFGNDKARKTSS
jgi:hypothetical protein